MWRNIPRDRFRTPPLYFPLDVVQSALGPQTLKVMETVFANSQTLLMIQSHARTRNPSSVLTKTPTTHSAQPSVHPPARQNTLLDIAMQGLPAFLPLINLTHPRRLPKIINISAFTSITSELLQPYVSSHIPRTPSSNSPFSPTRPPTVPITTPTAITARNDVDRPSAVVEPFPLDDTDLIKG